MKKIIIFTILVELILIFKINVAFGQPSYDANSKAEEILFKKYPNIGEIIKQSIKVKRVIDIVDSKIQNCKKELENIQGGESIKKVWVWKKHLPAIQKNSVLIMREAESLEKAWRNLKSNDIPESLIPEKRFDIYIENIARELNGIIVDANNLQRIAVKDFDEIKKNENISGFNPKFSIRWYEKRILEAKNHQKKFAEYILDIIARGDEEFKNLPANEKAKVYDSMKDISTGVAGFKMTPGKIETGVTSIPIAITPPGVFGKKYSEVTFSGIIDSIVGFLQKIAAPIFILLIMIGGVFYILNIFNPGYIQKGKDWIFWAIIGYFILLIASAIIALLKSVIGPS